MAKGGNESGLGLGTAKSGLEGREESEGHLHPHPRWSSLPRPACTAASRSAAVPPAAGRESAESLEEGALSAPVRVARRRMARKVKCRDSKGPSGKEGGRRGVGWGVQGDLDLEGGGGGGGGREEE